MKYILRKNYWKEINPFYKTPKYIQLFGKAAFVMDRGYVDNKMFLTLD